jgi:hypothetical protein
MHGAEAEAFYWEYARELGLVIRGNFPDAKMIAKSRSLSLKAPLSKMWLLWAKSARQR